MPLNGARELRVWAVLPAKRFTRAKTRLGGALAPADRRALAYALCDRVLLACRDSGVLAGTLVASDGGDVAALAARRGAVALRDAPGNGSLAGIVDAALKAVGARGATHALVLMADLPRVQARDVRELCAALRDVDLVLAPDALRRGTSALGLRLAPSFATAFGQPDSLQRHLREAARAGLSVRLLSNPRLARDIDLPEDLAAFALPATR